MSSNNILSIKQIDNIISSIPKSAMWTSTLKKPYLATEGYQLLYKLMYHGMFYADELAKLKKKDFDISKREIEILTSRSRRKAKVIFTSDLLWKEILEFIKDFKPDDYIFSKKPHKKPITRQTIWRVIKEMGKIAGITMSHPTKKTTNVFANALRESRAYHLAITRRFNQTELDQLLRKSPDEYSGLNTPSSIEDLRKKEKNANQELKVYCEQCEFFNPSIALFCCKCGESLRMGKSIL